MPRLQRVGAVDVESSSIISRKRSREEEDGTDVRIKRVRIPSNEIDRLSRLSDELILRIFCCLSVHDLNVCQRLSKKYSGIATDSQLWKIAYYHRFVRPIYPRSSKWREQLVAPTSLSRWLRSLHTGALAHVQDWKRQYRLRHNWSQGQCSKNEITVDDERPLPPLHICMHDGIVYTADSTGGLRAWSTRGDRRMLSKVSLETKDAPTSLAVDKSNDSQTCQSIVVGFRDGSFSIYSFDVARALLVETYDHPASSNGLLIAMATCFPFLITMTASQLLSIYRIDEDLDSLKPPLLLHSLRSQTIWPPLAVSLRSVGQSYIVAVTFVIPTVMNWNVGIQELYIGADGKLSHSRTASSAYAGAAFGSRASARRHQIGLSAFEFSAAAPAFSKPSSISYSHPYLLLSHPDNTLTLFMVKSSNEDLSISGGTRLWGHTSSVSGAHIEDRGKAVSVSAKGEELRIWELEGSLGRRWLLDGNWSIRVNPSHHETPSGDMYNLPLDNGVMRNWVAFDEQSVVVLKERPIGRTDLVVYDFT